MSFDITTLDTDLANIMADMPEQVEWFTGGVSQGLFAAMVGEKRHGHKLEEVAILAEYDTEILFRVAQFTVTKPNTGDIFTLASGVQVRAVNQHISADGVQILLPCEQIINKT